MHLIWDRLILTDAQALAIVHTTRPLQEHEQAGFLEALATLFAGRDTIGDGELGRVLREFSGTQKACQLRHPYATRPGHAAKPAV